MPCCRSETVGEWFFPGDGGVVPALSSGAMTFSRTRGDDGTVNLLRVRNDVMMPTGQYCCVVPDATGVDQLACIMIIRELAVVTQNFILVLAISY